MRISDWSSDVCSSDLAVIAAVGSVNGATEEELDHSWKENESDTGQWLDNEKKRWREGQFKARYAGDMAELLKYRTLRFDEGWPMVEGRHVLRSEEHTSELQSLMRISYAVFCLKK